MATSTLTTKGQITLPKIVRERLKVSAGDIERMNAVIRKAVSRS